MLERIIGVLARVKVLPYLAALTAFGIAGSANAQLIVNFDALPSSACTPTDGGCTYFNPAFEVAGFEVTHSADVGDDVIWGGNVEDGFIVELADGGFHGTMSFEEPVSAFELCLQVIANGADSATVTPIPLEGVGSPIVVNSSDEVCIGSTSGPFVGLEISAPSGELLQWDDLEVVIARDFVFTFNFPPNSPAVAPFWDPVFTQFTDEGSFTLSHQGAAPGNAIWDDDLYMTVFCRDCVEYFGPVGAEIELSDPVMSFTFRAANDSVGTVSTITPLLNGVVAGPPIEVDYSDGVYETFGANEGPYTSLIVSVVVNGSFRWDDLALTLAEEQAYDPNSTGARDVPVETDVEDSTVIQLDAFLMVASEVLPPVGGGEAFVDFDFCVARDPRETIVSPVASVYRRRALPIAEVAVAGNGGSCFGTLPGGETTLPNIGPVTTWQQLLSHVDLVIPPWNRTFRGEFEGEDGFWFVVASVRTNAEFNGPILVKEIPEIFPELVYDNLVDDTEDDGDGNDIDELACNTTVAMRPSGLAGLVTAFGEWPNVEGNLMIKSTFRCNRPETMTRRTHHVYPVRHDGVFVDQKAGLILQLAGIGATIQEAAASCAPPGSLNSMRVDLLAATAAALLHQWNKALMRLESIAVKANAITFSDSCIPRNYKGNLVARALTGAFTVWDSFLHPIPGVPWEKYTPPSGLVPPDPTIPPPIP